jgi:hypothetical protein
MRYNQHSPSRDDQTQKYSFLFYSLYVYSLYVIWPTGIALVMSLTPRGVRAPN